MMMMMMNGMMKMTRVVMIMIMTTTTLNHIGDILMDGDKTRLVNVLHSETNYSRTYDQQQNQSGRSAAFSAFFASPLSQCYVLPRG